MKNKRPLIYETIRPRVVYDITQYFTHNSELYQEEGIKLGEEWFPTTPQHDEEMTYGATDDDQPIQERDSHNSDDEWTESSEVDQVSTGNRDTLLTASDISDDGQHAFN